LLRDAMDPGEYLDALTEQRLYRDALQFVAHLLPPRFAVWWGCLCAWHAARPEPPSVVAEALHAAVRWVLDPSEANRRAAEAPGQGKE
jgi:hypothetical protein